jgi:polyvinyl alcohol dehydrogenase (cytochrome)
MSSGQDRCRVGRRLWGLCAILVVGGTAACASTDDGDENGESHFLCGSDADCVELGAAFVCGDGVCVRSADAPPDPSWTMLGYDPASTYFNRNEQRISRDSVGRLREALMIDLGIALYGAPLQVRGTLYAAAAFAADQGGVVAVDLSSGAILWESRRLSALASFAYVNGTLLMHDMEGGLNALDAATGTPRWRTPINDQPYAIGWSSPIIAGDQVYLGAGSLAEVGLDQPTFRGSVVATDLSGSVLWRTYTVPEGATGVGVWSSLSVDLAEGRAYATTGNNYTEPATDTADAFLAFDIHDGELLWKNQRLANDIFSTFSHWSGPDLDFAANPVLFEATIDGRLARLVAAGQKSGDIHVLDRDREGAEVCRRALSAGGNIGEDGIWNNTSWDGAHLLVAANGASSVAPGSEPGEPDQGQSVLFAIDPGTCDIVWERQLPGIVFAPITVANGVGFVGAGRHLQAFGTATGEKLYDYTAPATIASTPTVADGRVAFGSGLNWAVGTMGTTLIVLALP